MSTKVICICHLSILRHYRYCPMICQQTVRCVCLWHQSNTYTQHIVLIRCFITVIIPPDSLRLFKSNFNIPLSTIYTGVIVLYYGYPRGLICIEIPGGWGSYYYDYLIFMFILSYVPLTAFLFPQVLSAHYLFFSVITNRLLRRTTGYDKYNLSKACIYSEGAFGLLFRAIFARSTVRCVSNIFRRHEFYSICHLHVIDITNASPFQILSGVGGGVGEKRWE